MNLSAIISIHDVMPHTLERVRALIAQVPVPAQSGLVLLIVPGMDWQPHQIAQLARWQSQGIELAGHGWRHHTDDILTPYHHVHSWLVSRQAAEHLSLKSDEISELLRANYQWFLRQGLEPPQLYVPPAWALGRISRQQLVYSPFRYFETSAGLYDSEQNQHCYLPLVGFEADTRLRQILLSGWNGLNRLLASERRPLRLSIHPYDAQLNLSGALKDYLGRVTESVHYQTLFEPQEVVSTLEPF